MIISHCQIIDIHAVAGLLKGYLREISECIFTSDGVTKMLEAHRDITERTTKIKEFDRILYKLPPTNQACIKFLMKHLNRVTGMEKQNKMSVDNVSKIFGPTMLHYGKDTARMASLTPGDIMAQGQVVAFMMDNLEELFKIV